MPALKPDSGRLTDSDNADTLTDRIAERRIAKLLSCKAKPSSEILAGCQHL